MIPGKVAASVPWTRKDRMATMARRDMGLLDSVDVPSLAVGGVVGAAVVGIALPGALALASTAGFVPVAVSCAIAVGAGIALRGRKPPRSKAEPFRRVAQRKAGGKSFAVTAPKTPFEFLATAEVPPAGSVSHGARHALAVRALKFQIYEVGSPLTTALTDALLAFSVGRASLSILDDLAAVAVLSVDEIGEHEASQKALDAFKRCLSAVIPDLENDRARLGALHSFPATRMLAALAAARKRDVVPTSDFSWLSRHNRPLWLAACGLGATGQYAEGIGVMAHYLAELEAGHGIDERRVDAAAEALLSVPDAVGTSDLDDVED